MVSFGLVMACFCWAESPMATMKRAISPPVSTNNFIEFSVFDLSQYEAWASLGHPGTFLFLIYFKLFFVRPFWQLNVIFFVVKCEPVILCATLFVSLVQQCSRWGFHQIGCHHRFWQGLRGPAQSLQSFAENPWCETPMLCFPSIFRRGFMLVCYKFCCLPLPKHDQFIWNGWGYGWLMPIYPGIVWFARILKGGQVLRAVGSQRFHQIWCWTTRHCSGIIWRSGWSLSSGLGFRILFLDSHPRSKFSIL